MAYVINQIKEKRANHPLLFERDKRMVHLLANGQTTVEIGKGVFLSPKTVETIFVQLCQYHGCRNRVNLVAKFFREGWIK